MDMEWTKEQLMAANEALYERFDHLPAEHADAQILMCEVTALREALEEMVKDDAFSELCQGIGEEPSWLVKARALLTQIPKVAPERI
jgi:hypothetical protein